MSRDYSFVGRRIEKSIKEVRNRNRGALLMPGGESVLLYIPDGVNEDAEYDDVRQTYRNQDTKYKLYLNRDMFGCNRLYGDDTDTVPSALMAFPSNPESQSHRDDGFQDINRGNAWTLWEPILPNKGVIVVRQTGMFAGKMYLLENVTHSTFPALDKKTLHLLHQETPVTLLEDGIPVTLEDLPTVDETLSIFNNNLESNTNGFNVVGSHTQTDDGLVLNSGTMLSTTDNYLNNKIKVDVKFLSANGTLKIKFAEWLDSSKLSVIIDRVANTLTLNMFDNTPIKVVNTTLITNQIYNLRIELSGVNVKIWLDDKKLLAIKLSLNSNYNTLQPLSESVISFENGSTNILLHNFFILELI